MRMGWLRIVASSYVHRMVAASSREARRLSTPNTVDSVGTATAIITAARPSTTMISMRVTPRWEAARAAGWKWC